MRAREIKFFYMLGQFRYSSFKMKEFVEELHAHCPRRPRFSLLNWFV
jgi:hypothetical protein